MSRDKTHVILNPASSAGRTGRRQDEIEAALARHLGRGFILRVTRRPREATAFARQAALEGTDLVIAVGGDGTIQEVVNGLMEAGASPPSGPALGIVNTGTGHGFALSLGLPVGLDAQCAAIASGSRRRVDIGRAVYADVDGRRVERYFVNECQAGIGGRVVEKVQAGHKKLGGLVGFGLAALTTALSYPNLPMTVSIDGGPERSGSFIGIVAANGPLTAGGMKLAPAALVADGRLDILFMNGQTLLERLRNFPKIYSGRHIESPGFSYLRAKTLSLDSEEPVFFEADGEPFGLLPCRIEVVPAALALRAPGPAEGGEP
ncbi:MAG TPA: diacylglycerol kinase family lipid kinase [Candidatus Aminicenantes bacterium]|nr:diacylglycerol kinase family lipid kinase [Candidatus Aminicenantes bacterium]